MVRVAIVTQGFNSAGGVQAVARWLRDQLATRHEVSVFDVANSRHAEMTRRLVAPRTWIQGPQLDPESLSRDHRRAGTALAELEITRYLPTRRLTAALRGHDAVFIVAGGPALGLCAMRAGRPLFLQIATTMRSEREALLRTYPPIRRTLTQAMTWGVSLIERAVLRSATTVFVENPEMLKYVQETTPGTRVVLSPPGVDDTKFLPACSGWNSRGPIIAVGRLNDPRKGYLRMLEAYSRLLGEGSYPDLIIIGRGDPTPLVKIVEDFGLADRVAVHANVPEAEYVSVLPTGSVFWQTSYEEGLGIAVIEAMAAGLPVVATATAGTRVTIRDGVTGYLVSQGPPFSRQMIDSTKNVLQGNGQAMSSAARSLFLEDFSTSATSLSFLTELEPFLPDPPPQ